MLYAPPARRWLLQNDTPDADDLVQEDLFALARDLRGFDHHGRTGTFQLWVRSITANDSAPTGGRADRGRSMAWSSTWPGSKIPTAHSASSGTARTTNSPSAASWS